jgi:hypothetical protein
MPGPLDDIARKMPASTPGTIFGFPVSTLRDPAVQKKILFVAGVALIASIFVPFTTSPMMFAWSSGVPKFSMLVWPIIAGAAYLLLTAAPPHVRQQVPPAVLQWIPFAVAFIGLFVSKMGFGGVMGRGGSMGGAGTLYILGYATLVFGLLARISSPQDQVARIVIGVGALMLAVPLFDGIDFFFEFSHLPGLFILHNLLWFAVFLIGIFCVVFAIPPAKLPPGLQAIDALAPLFAAVLIAWLPVQQILFALIGIVHMKEFGGSILVLAHGLLPIVAYFGVLMMASPAAYEEAKALIAGKGG